MENALYILLQHVQVFLAHHLQTFFPGLTDDALEGVIERQDLEKTEFLRQYKVQQKKVNTRKTRCLRSDLGSYTQSSAISLHKAGPRHWCKLTWHTTSLRTALQACSMRLWTQTHALRRRFYNPPGSSLALSFPPLRREFTEKRV